MLQKIICFIALLSLPSAFAGGPLDALSFMKGTWKGTRNGAIMEAYYTGPDGGTILGVTKITSPSGKLEFFEYERFTATPDGVKLIPAPFGNEGVHFTLTELSFTRAVFENPAHDFPSKIQYELRPDGTFLARIEGEKNGEPLAQEFVFRKVGL